MRTTTVVFFVLLVLCLSGCGGMAFEVKDTAPAQPIEFEPPVDDELIPEPVSELPAIEIPTVTVPVIEVPVIPQPVALPELPVEEIIPELVPAPALPVATPTPAPVVESPVVPSVEEVLPVPTPTPAVEVPVVPSADEVVPVATPSPTPQPAATPAPVATPAPLPTPAPTPAIQPASSIELSLNNAYQAYGKISLATLESMAKLYAAHSPVPLSLSMHGQVITARLEQAVCTHVSGSNVTQEAVFHCDANIVGQGFVMNHKKLEIKLQGIPSEPTHVIFTARLLN